MEKLGGYIFLCLLHPLIKKRGIKEQFIRRRIKLALGGETVVPSGSERMAGGCIGGMPGGYLGGKAGGGPGGK